MGYFEAFTIDGDCSGFEPPGLEAYDWGREAVHHVLERMRLDGAHDPGHLARVFEHARAITRGERGRGAEVDWEVLAAAVLFHDVVNLPKDSDERESASRRSARCAAEYFDGRGVFDSRRTQCLMGAVERHSYSRGLRPETLEGEILRDADRLEALGAVGIARCFSVSGAMEGAIAHPTDPFAEERELDDTAYAIDHFFEKLLELRGSFLTETGRELAERRHTFLEEFLDQFAREVGGDWERDD